MTGGYNNSGSVNGDDSHSAAQVSDTTAARQRIHCWPGMKTHTA